jgi:YidC/Oxa1 family membrane protein insertase
LSSLDRQSQQNFFDPRTIFAIVLITASFMGWQYYIKTKYPDAGAKPTVDGTPPKTAETAPDGAAPADVAASAPLATAARTQAPVAEKTTAFENDTMSFEISSRGMGLRNLKLNKYTDRAGQIVQMGQAAGATLPLETRLLGREDALNFEVDKVGDRRFVGQARVGDLTVTKSVEVVPEKYLLRYHVSVKGRAAGFVGLNTFLTEELETPQRGSLILPHLDKQEFFIDTVETHDRTAFPKTDLDKEWGKVKLASIGSQYFTETIIDRSPILPDAKAFVRHGDDAARVALEYHVLNPDQEMTLEYDAYVGPKSYALLRSIDPALSAVVDFGFFNWIARHIFGLLQWIQSIVGNWGLAIICLTVVVRACVLPFNIYSYKSMRAMQAIQPQLQAVRERYKDDQQTQQVETMKLMRENKVNPVGGCLPVLFQIPIFFALYQVLGHSIELYQAPFGLWIHDLSLKDPFYILPVLMGITMFLQQRTTPNATMDPTQQKVLMFMPLLFTFFMITLPSGLTLYMWVGAVFSVAQQTYFMKSNKAPAVSGKK